MKLFYNIQFDGHYPVGTSAIVWAKSAMAAAQILSDELKANNLSQVIDVNDMVEFKLVNKCIILQDGDY